MAVPFVDGVAHHHPESFRHLRRLLHYRQECRHRLGQEPELAQQMRSGSFLPCSGSRSCCFTPCSHNYLPSHITLTTLYSIVAGSMKSG
ncbi:MAG: hypothetical protein AVDCRST_MAG26-2287 [uncultured Chloroflexia bacterium]|uniref:Uncharacterized protein n=1 Tax=uncultured Chloroflexia bacterium TaxID=1672391 RepID=A0A6J4IRH5_9CHLR|nr:MAG: hypothetical protein AVDCRST_MAG26-2287 [uncultured Chloroflexia bacterium]